jgi:hypothetical protein
MATATTLGSTNTTAICRSAALAPCVIIWVEAGLDSSIITTRGYGKSSPRVPGTTPEARAKNRRVEIGIVDVSLDFGSEVRR